MVHWETWNNVFHTSSLYYYVPYIYYVKHKAYLESIFEIYKFISCYTIMLNMSNYVESFSRSYTGVSP